MGTVGNFRSTAMQCRRFKPLVNDAFVNSTGERITCLNCGNFKNNHCSLDLYDKINDLK
jgi:hypothetical protein